MAPRLSHEDYTVAWISAMSVELAAAKVMLDETHESLTYPGADNNTYTLGRVHGHNVVISCLPMGIYGITSAAITFADMKRTFPSLEFGLMVGIGGGVPSKTDIRLGDVVVSKPTASESGVIQYDFGKMLSAGEFQRTGSSNKPPRLLLNALNDIESEFKVGNGSIGRVIAGALKSNEFMREEFSRPDDDWLFDAAYDHRGSDGSCLSCDRAQLVKRKPRGSGDPSIHYGLIASGNSLVRDALSRDRIAEKNNILCFEMEAAGLIDQKSCLVIRGICGYCDSHKNKQWQGYAALAAASYAKLLLSLVHRGHCKTNQGYRTNLNPEESDCLSKLIVTDPSTHMNATIRRQGERSPDTCEWILSTNKLKTWIHPQDATESHSSILWLYGNPGVGKSTIAIAIAEQLPNHINKHNDVLAYFFCGSHYQERSCATAILRGLLYHMMKQYPHLLKHLLPKFNDQKEKLFASFDGLWNVLMDIGRHNPNGKVYCIIDALDECDPESQNILLTQIRLMIKGTKSGRLGVHFLITSRPYTDIKSHFNLLKCNCKDLSSYQETQDDLKTFMAEKVTELSRANDYPDKVAKSVSRILSEKAQGTFLWVGIVCNELAGVRSKDAVKTLEGLPRGLDSLYTRLLTTALEANSDNKSTILKLLSYVAVSWQPLTLLELAVACELYESEDEQSRENFMRDNVEMCRFMIVVQDESVHLLHQSVKDFLFHAQGGSLINMQRANALLANRCIDHHLLIMAASKSEESKNQNTLFLRYAVLYWPEHASLAKSEFDVLPAHSCFFQTASDQRENWLQAYNHEQGNIVKGVEIRCIECVNGTISSKD